MNLDPAAILDLVNTTLGTSHDTVEAVPLDELMRVYVIWQLNAMLRSDEPTVYNDTDDICPKCGGGALIDFECDKCGYTDLPF